MTVQMARVPHASYDNYSNRWLINWRYPKELQPLIGSEFFRDRFPRNLTPKQAAERETEKRAEFFAIRDAARDHLATLDGATTAFGVVMRNIIAARKERLATLDSKIGKITDEIELTALTARLGLPVPVTSGRQPITIDRVIAQWTDKRTAKDDSAKDKAIKAYHSALSKMFKHLGKPDDFAKLRKVDLIAYAEDLETGKVASTAKNGRKPHPKSHLEIIVAMCGVAVRVAAKDGWDMPNPAIDLEIPEGSGKTGDKFTDAERLAILSAARHAEPVTKWAHWLMAFSGAYPSELSYLTPANVFQEDGRAVIDIKPPEGSKLKTEWRPRKLPIPSAVIREGFLDYVETIRREHGDAPLFPITPAQFDKAVNGLIKGIRIGGEPIKLRSKAHRHYVATELEGFDVPDEKGRKLSVSDYVCGHSPGKAKGESGRLHNRVYVHIAVPRLVAPIESLIYPDPITG